VHAVQTPLAQYPEEHSLSRVHVVQTPLAQ